MKNKSGGNGSKIILGDFNCSMDKMDRDGGKKRQKGYGCGSKYSHSKLISNNGLKDLWRRDNSDFSEFAHYYISSVTRSTIDRVYTDIKNANNTKINHIMVYFSDHFNAISLDRLPKKTKIGKNYWYFNNSLLFLYKPEFSSTTNNVIF